MKRFNGKGTLKAVKNINDVIAPALVNKNCLNYKSLDLLLLELDGTPTKHKLGSNATTPVSIVLLKAAAHATNTPVFQYLNPKANTLPIPFMNILNGGIHADNNLDIQEFMIVPVGAKSFKEAVRMGCEIFYHLKMHIKKANLDTAVGDEGGFAPQLSSATAALDFILRAIDASEYKIGRDVCLALDVAASELYTNGKYHFAGENKEFSHDELIKYYETLVKNYPIISIEDGMAEDDERGWKDLTSAIGAKTQLVGDDVFVSNAQSLKHGIENKMANAVLIKPNQIGSITEMLATIDLAHKHSYNCMMSHRSGETEDTVITHLAVGTGCTQIKIGAPCRVDRTAKYNELIRIQELLGTAAKYASIKPQSHKCSTSLHS
jgi:enolase